MRLFRRKPPPVRFVINGDDLVTVLDRAHSAVEVPGREDDAERDGACQGDDGAEGAEHQAGDRVPEGGAAGTGDEPEQHPNPRALVDADPIKIPEAVLRGPEFFSKVVSGPVVHEVERRPKQRHRPRTSGVGARRVLIRGTRKAAPHPWRARLHAATNGSPTDTVAAHNLASAAGAPDAHVAGHASVAGDSSALANPGASS